MNDFEIKIVKYLSDFGKGKIDSLTSAISSVSFLAIFWFLIVSFLLVFFPENRNSFLLMVIVVTVLHFGISEGFFKYILPKFIEIRKRPYIQYPEIIKPIGHQFSDSSIPSSHITSTVAMLFILSFIFPILIWPSVLFVLLMGFARIHNGMHYPTDVTIGVALGVSYGLISIWILR